MDGSRTRRLRALAWWASAWAPLLLGSARAAYAYPPEAAPDGGVAPAAVSLAWVRAEGAESCPDGDRLARAVSERLGRDPFGASPAQRIEAVVSREGARWTVRVFARDGDGAAGALLSSREITGEAADCAPIAAAAVVAIAVAIDAEAAARYVPPPPAPAASTAPTAPTTPARRAPGVAASVRAWGGLGILPALTPGVGLTVEPFAAGRVHVTAAGVLFAEQTAPSPRVGFGLAALSAGACVDALASDRVALAGCASLWLGAMHTVVYELVPVDPSPRPWVAGSLGARFAVRLAGPLTAEMALDALVPFTAYRFFVEGSSQTIFEAPPVALLGSLGVGVHFW